VGINVIRLDGGLIVAVDTAVLADDIERSVVASADAAPARDRGGAFLCRAPDAALGWATGRNRRARARGRGRFARGARGTRARRPAGRADGKPLERIDDLYAALDTNVDAIELAVLRGTIAAMSASVRGSDAS